MVEQPSPRHKTHVLVVLAALVIILFGISEAQSVLTLLLVSVFLAVLGTPPVLWLIHRKVPESVAALIVIAAMIGVLLLVGAIVGASIASFSASLPQYQSRLQEQTIALKDFLANKGITVTDKILLDYVNPAAIMSLTAVLLAGLSSALSSIVLILLTVLFILLEVPSFEGKLNASPGDPRRFIPRFKGFVEHIQRYVVIKTGISITTGILVGIWLLILGVEFPVLWGFLAFLLNYVPSLGVVIAAIPAVLFAWIQIGAGHAALVAVGYLAINFIVGTAIEPKIVGKGIGLSTLVVFLSLILWGKLFGLIGAVLCVPITMTLKFLLEINEETRWMAVWLGPNVEEDLGATSKK